MRTISTIRLHLLHAQIAQQAVAVRTNKGKTWSGKIEKVEDQFVQIRYESNLLVHLPISVIEEVRQA
ncbi:MULTISPECIES: hypothetical protein [unclassified Paenibacillus]|uniref:hypothetical protein n=1 Tax=unclassified Paenibacillus TaxID=185978 RepID=UPI001044630E|nr:MULTISPECIES: hypothetical protein [unclassified Paenibacillus]NIK67825.1 ribosome maturation factor RimP [Paenibacillus sp. BK720]TCN01866.1 hypothetical protein EV294_1011327 [Paenibacillus sp. BK033]